MLSLIAERLKAYRNDVDAADRLITVGLTPLPPELENAELACWTHVARVLLNLHETITRQ
jgi:hypothetical protein